MVFDKTWDAIKNDFNRLNPFDTSEKQKDGSLGLESGFNSTDTIGRGAASEKYNFQQLTYPIDLFTASRDAHAPYMMIFINSRTGDSYDGSKKSKGEFVTDINENQMRVGTKIRGDVVKDKNTVIGTMGLLSTGLGGTLGGLVGGISGAGLGAGAGLAASVVLYNTLDESDFNREAKRLKAAIALHMPNQLDIRYGMQYKNDNAANTVGVMNVLKGAIGGVAGGLQGIKDYAHDSVYGIQGPPKPGTTPVGDIVDSIKNTLNQGGKIIDATVKDPGNRAFGLGAAMQLMPGGDTLSATTGIAPNPKMQSVFEGVDPRTFTYSYSFFPRSQAELDNIYRITKILKYHMHPAFKDSTQFLFNYPSTFNIEFFVGGERNEYLHKHTGCVLTNMSIDYTPNGQYAYFNSNGAPIQINIRMDFRELEILTSEDIADNY